MSQLAFQYQAIDRRGGRTKGVLHAGDRKDAYRQVLAAGMQPVRIQEVTVRRSRGKRVTVRDLAQLTYQFSVLMEARLPVADGLRSVADQEQNPRLQAVLNDVANRIVAGSTITEALGAHHEVFGEVYIETVRAAEKSGNLIEVLQRLSEMLERQYELEKSFKGALMYPICVVCALALALIFLMMFVVPRFAAMFESRGVDLPLPTQLLVGGSAILTGYWPLLAGLGVGGWFLIRRAFRKRETRERIDRALHRVPYIRDMLRGTAINRFAQVFGLTMRSGLNLIDALEISGRASGRPMLMADVEKMREQVKHGGRLADVLLTCAYLPAFTRRMFTAGEEAGELARMCGVVARHYDREVTHLTRNIVTVIEPILIAGLAGIVLVIALAIFLPMWSMAALVG